MLGGKATLAEMYNFSWQKCRPHLVLRKANSTSPKVSPYGQMAENLSYVSIPLKMTRYTGIFGKSSPMIARFSFSAA